jgi:hypothetical protein
MNPSACWFHQGEWFDGIDPDQKVGNPFCPACLRRASIVDRLRRGAFDQLKAEEIESVRYAPQPNDLSGSDIERAVARGINNRGSY